MTQGHPLPDLWLLSDERNAHRLHIALRSFPVPVGFVYRHYHLPPAERFAEYRRLARIARAEGHLVILSDSAMTAREWGADGIYGAPLSLYPRRADLLRIATAHDMREIAQATRIGADAVMLSPVFPTRSHPGAKTLGPQRFLHMAKHAQMPVIALGGMTARRERRLRRVKWAAIDGLSD
ncbi:thiamine phosphate synthase [Aurantiacibacter aquimixticola]|uniref:Thiamine phosphate synthase n=1 Tax=Aurantiacibacter aquimixticola TaxID=1958945 RepID=A0A419RUG8_9SPHN|nr:thiamine phosphate synthase [Aurantiacibacter aquimixticola]RJY09394.1 thiamine phosphate synthase [Aurantiacibacter aquimixticola]